MLIQKNELEEQIVEMTDGGLIHPLIVEEQQTVEVLDGKLRFLKFGPGRSFWEHFHVLIKSFSDSQNALMRPTITLISSVQN